MRLVGTTKSTIASIRDRTHWNSANLAPMDPVTLGLCLADRSRLRGLPRQQGKAGAGRHRRDAAAGGRDHRAQGSEVAAAAAAEAQEKPGGSDLDVSAVFAKLKQLGGKAGRADEEDE